MKKTALNEVEYVCIDFETAQASMTSACSIGIVGANKGKIVFSEYYLINPHEEFFPQNTEIHGITYDDVKYERDFKEVWEIIKKRIDNNIIFAHAASFDIGVLKALFDKYNIEYPTIRIGCTLKVSRIAFKDSVTNFRLNTLSNYLEIEHNHHEALSDAMVCFYILERAKRMYQVYDVVDLFDALSLGFGTLNPKFYRSCYSKLNNKLKQVTKSNRLEGQIVAFSGKPKTMTKTEAKNMIVKAKGIYSKDITKAITTFIIFTNPEKKKLLLLERIKEYKEVLIFDELSFKEYLNNGK